MSILIEYIVVYLIVLVIFLFLTRGDDRKKGKKIPTELLYLKKVYHVSISKIDRKKFRYLCCYLNSFIISSIYLILIYLVENLIVQIILGVILLLLMIIIGYGFLARYYLRKEDQK